MLPQSLASARHKCLESVVLLSSSFYVLVHKNLVYGMCLQTYISYIYIHGECTQKERGETPPPKRRRRKHRPNGGGKETAPPKKGEVESSTTPKSEAAPKGEEKRQQHLQGGMTSVATFSNVPSEVSLSSLLSLTHTARAGEVGVPRLV